MHEATHARLLRVGIGYDRPIRKRVEEACNRREIAFARRLWNGQALVGELVLELSEIDDYSDYSVDWRKIHSARKAIARFEELEAPRWFIRWVEWLARRQVRRFEKRYGFSPGPPTACN